MNFDIDCGAENIINELRENGYSAYIVGGCIRDTFMHVIPHDWDICTSASPDDMLRIFSNHKIIDTGSKYGTITVILNNAAYECTTYRSSKREPDDYSNLKEDLMHRDFTINAMAYNDKDGLIDLFGGQTDIKNGIIRCTNDPMARFSEDALRIMRALRFSAKYGFSIDPDTHLAMINMADDLKNISAERLNRELCEIISSPLGADVLHSNPKIICTVIPELKVSVGFDQKNPYHDFDVFTHTTNALKNCNSTDIITRLAVFFHDIGKPYSMQEDSNGQRHFKGHGNVSAVMTDSIMKKLRFDNHTRTAVTQLVSYHDANIEPQKKHIRRWLNRIGEIQFRRLLDVRCADIQGQKTEYDPDRINKIRNVEKILDEILTEQHCFSIKDLAVNGNDLIKIGITPGKQMGMILNDLLIKVINEEIHNDHDSLINAVNTLIK